VTSDVEYLDVDDLLLLAEGILGVSPAPVRDAGLLGSAAWRPRTTVGGEDAYPTIWEKAAALLQSLLKNHALVDGNKRLAWLATATFLYLNGVDATDVSNDAVYDFVIDVTTGDYSVLEIANALRLLIRRT
jgi:death-on-curing protein